MIRIDFGRSHTSVASNFVVTRLHHFLWFYFSHIWVHISPWCVLPSNVSAASQCYCYWAKRVLSVPITQHDNQISPLMPPVSRTHYRQSGWSCRWFVCWSISTYLIQFTQFQSIKMDDSSRVTSCVNATSKEFKRWSEKDQRLLNHAAN